MEFVRPDTLGAALAAKAERPGAVPIAGGTDVMVELNYDQRRPDALLDLTEIELASVRGERRIPAAGFYTGVKRSAVAADELITAVHLPAADGAAEQFSKIGTRNAMVIAVCSLALVLREGYAGAAIGSAAPTPRRVPDAEAFLVSEPPRATDAPLPDSLTRRFGELVAAGTEPVDDVRGTAECRTHALGVLVRRTLTWAWDDYRRSVRACA
ncbi:hypothetical protein GCM10009676_26790 [Prauserella halophila]|uniref:CO dehydrogenase flavoprotein C-terminal domain-containing protein n=1 Tax=Prauserella halophila TaxID=185641 RepID=A0ABP4GWM8_9PSEU|nr:FAD binding domain-containing protein [Prauserella halophila]MCP2235055.1 CO dehydrogenase flavoprotein C-terminal domain-containing protein [Prauserella halophila]